MRTEIITITPDIAEAMLKANTRNYRKYNSHLIQMYAEDMRNGNWKLNGEPIVFYKNGSLANGQHRLMAVVKSGVSIQFLVVYDVDDDTMEYDLGKSRNDIDVVRSFGLEASNTSIAAVSFITSRYYGYKNGYTSSKVSKIKFYKKHEETLNKALSIVACGSSKPACKIGLLLMVAFILLELGWDEMLLRDFFKVANSGYSNGILESSAITFKKCLDEWKHTGKKSTNICDIAYLALCDFEKRKPRKQRYIPNNEFEQIFKTFIELDKDEDKNSII